MKSERHLAPSMIVLSGEQVAPNLLPARHLKPEVIHVFYTDHGRSKVMAERLGLCLTGTRIELHCTSAYDIGTATSDIRDVLAGLPSTIVNVTGGTKPMSMAALLAAKKEGRQAFYVRSEGHQTQLDFYDWSSADGLRVRETATINDTIEIDDYLSAYFGIGYQFDARGRGSNDPFENTVHDTLKPDVDEIKTHWEHESGALEVDFVVRCGNQVGIVEAKTGKKARKTDGLKQLAVAGGQRFFGTYAKRFLVVDQELSDQTNIKRLAQAIGVILIELPSCSQTGKLSVEDADKLVLEINGSLGKPSKKRAI